MKALISFKLLTYSSLFIGCFCFAGTEDWSNWRGPNYNGSTSDSFSYPENFSINDGLKWSFDLPGASASTPVVNDDLVFLSTVSTKSSSEDGKLLAICLNRKSGKLIWEKNVGSGYKPGNGDGLTHKLDSKSNYASPSPVAYEGGAVFFFGNGDLININREGEIVWSKNIQKEFGDFCFQWTFAATPTVIGSRVYLPVLQRDEPVHGRGKANAKSFIHCFNLRDGSTLWSYERKTAAKMESRESFTTLIPYQGDLLLAGGDFLSSHDPESGHENWRWGTWNQGHKQAWWRLVPSPVPGKFKALVCAPKGAPVYTVKIPENETKVSSLIWDSSGEKQVTSDVPTPLYYRERFYVLSDLKKNLSCLDEDTGEIVWNLSLPGKYKWRSSPTGGDGKIYLMNHNAMVLVVDADKGSIIHQTKMGGTYDDLTRSSIVLNRGSLLIKTNEKLYCID